VVRREVAVTYSYHHPRTKAEHWQQGLDIMRRGENLALENDHFDRLHHKRLRGNAMFIVFYTAFLAICIIRLSSPFICVMMGGLLGWECVGFYINRRERDHHRAEAKRLRALRDNVAKKMTLFAEGDKN